MLWRYAIELSYQMSFELSLPLLLREPINASHARPPSCRPPWPPCLHCCIGLMMMWLTFDIQFNEGRFTHAQGILSNTLVSACSGSRHGANGDFFVRAEDSIDTFFLPPNLSWRVAFSHTPHGDRILFFFQVAQRSRLSDNIWWIWRGKKRKLLMMLAHAKKNDFRVV